MKHKLPIIQSLFTFLLLLSLQNSIAQDIMMQGWYWDYPKTTDGNNWADTIAAKATELANAGITHVWLPPLSRASFGNGSNGYDPKDLFDLGEFGGGATGFGTRSQLDDVIELFGNVGIEAVADVVYNHRDGGIPETNPAVEGWIENYNSTKVNAGDAPFPSDRFRCILPLGGASGNSAGDYYFKIRSASQHANFYNKPYKVYMQTNTVGFQNQTALTESEPNGGGDCGQGFNALTLGVDMNATTDGSGCLTDEFKLTLSASDFDAAGDTLYIFLTNANGNYSDHFIYGIYSIPLAQDIQSQVVYQTYTDFTSLPSGRGGMNYNYFRPNGNPTSLSGDTDGMWFFYDYDQTKQETIDTLQEWSKWLWEDVGIRGYRMDAVKHFPYAFTGNFMDYLYDQGIYPNIVVGEYFDTNAGTLKGWVDNVLNEMDADTKDSISVRAFDFSLRKALKDACDAFGYDARDIFNAGIVDGAGGSGFQAITFLNNHDYRESFDPPVQNDPILGYAYLLTNNQVGLPCIFYPDYYGTEIPNSPNVALKEQIDDLLQIHKVYINGSTGRDYLSRHSTPYFQNITNNLHSTTVMYQLMGTPTGNDIIVVINFAGETLDMTHGVNVNVNLPNGTILTDLTGTSNTPTTTVTGGNITVSIPARSYAVFGVDVCGDLDATMDETEASCHGGEDGTATVTATGGTGTYTYEWSNGATTDMATGLTAGDYTVIVEDENNCKITKSATITETQSAVENPSTYDLQFANEQKGCGIGEQFCVDIQIKAASAAPDLAVGSHTIWVNYNKSAINNPTYTAANFFNLTASGGGATECEISPENTYQPYFKTAMDSDESGALGDWNVTTIMNSSGFVCNAECPIVNNTDWVSFGTICFDVVDGAQTSDLSFDATLTVINQSNDEPQHTANTLGTLDILPSATSPMADAGQDVTICEGNSTQLGATGGDSYTWTPDDGSLDDASIANPTASPTSTTVYTVVVTDSNGCTDSAQVTVNVDNSANCCPDGVSVEYENTNNLPTLTQTSDFIRAGNLNSNGNVVVQNGQTITFQATNSVQLEAGFEVENGGVFAAILEACNAAPLVEVAAMEENTETTSSKTTLQEISATVYPNPFNESTTIEYFLPQNDSPVTLSIYDLSGKVVQHLINNQLQQAGRYRVTFTPCDLADGVYVCVLQVGGDRRVVKLLKG
ncbi:MAG: T9SS type A sorting domain-containing protein [Chitinophagales bacterium]